MKCGDFSQNLSGITILDFFSKFKLVFAVSEFAVSYLNQEGLEKT